MKVAIIDNTCNNGYVLMRYLNDQGIDTDLLLLGAVEGHADPDNDSFDKQYFNKIIDTGWSTKGVIWLSKKEITDVLDKYDFVIGSDLAPAIFYKAGRKLDVFLPHGTDLFNYPFARLNGISRKIVGEWILARWQRKGIDKHTDYFMFELTNDENEKYVKYFKNGKFKRVYKTTPLVYHPQYEKQSAIDFFKANEKVSLLRRLRSEGNSIVFHHCQQQWANPYHLLFNKGNDKLIRGLKQFIDRHPNEKIKLVMVERGTDVQTSKDLIKELGVEDYVVWFPVMPRKEIMACLTEADLGVGELGHSWFTYCVVIEFMALGIPIIHYCDMDYYRKVHDSVYPMYNASTADHITTLLENYFADKASFNQTGLAARDWWRKNLVDDTMKSIADIINGQVRKNQIAINK